MKNTAKLSECRKYRYALWRTWDDSKPYVMFVGLNPSTADENTDRKVRILRDHGSEKKYYHDEVGYNYRMEGIQGAVLGVKLKYL